MRCNPASYRAAQAQAISTLINAHADRKADVAVVAISASERQVNNRRLENFSEFQNRLNALGLGNLELLRPMRYFDVTFWDFSLWSDKGMQAMERSIHEILFPNIPFLWADYCAEKGLDPTAVVLDRKWKNAKCDVQALWSHAWQKRDVFVTSDGNFLKQEKLQRLIALVGGRIETPASAVALIEGMSGS